MRQIVLQLNSSHLENERSIWICEPESVSGASDLVVFLDAERYRDRVDALSVIEELRGQVADSWFVFISQLSPEARWYPGSFQRIISQSGSFWWNDFWLEIHCWWLSEGRSYFQRQAAPEASPEHVPIPHIRFGIR